MTGKKLHDGMTLFTGALILLLILWLPIKYTQPLNVHDVFILFCIWTGLLLTVTMRSKRTIGTPITLFPIFPAYMAVTGYSLIQEAGFILATFLGALVYEIRTDADIGSCSRLAIKFMLINLLSLRITTLIIQQHRVLAFDSQYITATALIAAVILTVFFSCFIQLMIKLSNREKLQYTFMNSIKPMIYPALLVLFLLPAAIQANNPPADLWEWNIAAGVAAILVVQIGLSVLVDRAKFSYSRTRFLENELGKHSEILTNLETSIEALRTLAQFWYRAAEPVAVKVTWKHISMTYPAGVVLPENTPLSRSGTGGLLLEVWPSLRTTLDAERLEIFISQTETVLQNLELRNDVLKRGWKCLEAMVYSLDMSDSRQTGYSKEVATIARNIGRKIGIDSETLEDLEMAAMLHLTATILDKAEEDRLETLSAVPSRVQFHLPPDVVRGIRHITENFDGSGKPENMHGRSIPIIARILSVSIDFIANLSNQSVESSILELKRRTGAIYDPEIVAILEEIVMQQDNLAI